MRVELVFSKHQGEKVTARLRYSFIANTGGPPTSFRMGIEVPVAVGGDGETNFSVVVSDGEVVELTSATDPISGEVSKVELSLKVMK